jgi:hypothetical protein
MTKIKSLLKIILSNGGSILIDNTELAFVMNAISRGDRNIICKNGSFNSSFYVDCVFATKEMAEFQERARIAGEEQAKQELLPGRFAELLKEEVAEMKRLNPMKM